MNIKAKLRFQKLIRKAPDLLTSLIIFAFTLAVFWLSPVHQVSDSRFSMLVSQDLISYGSFALDNYNIPRYEPFQREDYVMNGEIYQLEIANNHIYYFFPIGSSVLSVPYVVITNAFGLSPANPDGTYNHQNEITIERGLAAILMAALTAILFFTARLLLPLRWSVVIALGAAFGTQIWSTASRALWSHTWSALLLGIVLYLLVAGELGRRRPQPLLLATLLSWMYFVRPSNSLFIVAISLYLAIYYREILILYILTGLAWLSAFIVYSWHHFGHLLPNYYRASRLSFRAFPVAFPGNLISPGRGLLVYVPILMFVAYLLFRYRKHLPLPKLTMLSLLTVAANALMISGFAHWWGGASFGNRFSTDAVPWFVLLSILGVRAMLDWREKSGAPVSSLAWNAQLGAGLLLLTLSVFINGRGAMAFDTWKWNEQPKDLPLIQKKLWDWRQPQFLGGLIRPPLDREYPLLEATGTYIDFTKPEANKYLWYGWSGPEPEFRWTEASEAAMVFALNNITDLSVKMKVLPFVAPGLHDRQRLTISLNGNLIESLTLNEKSAPEHYLTLPANLLAPHNVLVFELPDAITPESLKISTEQRPLGISLREMEIRPK